MEIGSAEWRALICEGASAHGLAVSAEQAAAFAAHAQALLLWNKRINLTRIVAADAVAIRHFVDSLTLVPYLEGCRTIVDIGTGGGFPGMVVAVMMPESRVVMVDAVRKKISFLQYFIRLRGVANADAVHARAEEVRGIRQIEPDVDAVVSRAFGDLPATLHAAASLAGENTRIIAMRGPHGGAECAEFMASSARDALAKALGFPVTVRVSAFHLPRGHGQRHLLIFERQR